ncbi:helix-turn-helix domain-containing protein [Longirhabdus pacifica]|uniref:helix-turn-helix domain-containing protein n=1 Tax=Longirhabdus pacifica TaxID=2305227 RepID=UPI0013E8E214|nr:helix-turn-helix domain-containing protein [Longirhabdus pacifica]
MKKTRLEQQYTLDQMEEITKIRKSYLQAIEEGKYNILPGNFYARAFIKSYAEALGLDSNHVMELYKNVLPQAYAQPTNATSTGRRKKALNVDKVAKWVSLLLFISFFILIVVVIYLFVLLNGESDDHSIQMPEPVTGRFADSDESVETVFNDAEENNVQEELAEEQAEEVVASTVTLVEQVNNVYTYEVANTDQINIKIEYTGRCWTQIRKGDAYGEVLDEITPQQDDTYTFESQNNVWISLGNSNAKLYINDVELEGTDVGMRVQINVAGVNSI